MRSQVLLVVFVGFTKVMIIYVLLLGYKYRYFMVICLFVLFGTGLAKGYASTEDSSYNIVIMLPSTEDSSYHIVIVLPSTE